MVLPETRRARTQARRAVVGEIGDGRPPIGDAVTERTPSLVRDLERQDRESFDECLAGLETVEGPRAGQPGRRDREVRRGHEPPEDALGVTLCGDIEIDPGTVAVAGGEKRKPLGVVPVHVAEHDRPLVRLAVEQVGAPPEKVAGQSDTGARVDDQAREVPVEREGEARRVAAVADKLRPGCRCRATNATDPDSH